MSESDTTVETEEVDTTEEVSQEDMYAALTEWQNKLQATAEAKRILEEEREARKKVIGMFFPKPKEGTQRFDLPQEWKLKFVNKIKRDVDKAALPSVTTRLREQGYLPELMFTWEPKLKIDAYRNLVTDGKKILEDALVISQQTGSLELEPPKEPKEK